MTLHRNRGRTQFAGRAAIGGMAATAGLVVMSMALTLTAAGCEQVEDEPVGNPGEMSSPVQEHRGGSGSTPARARDAAKRAIGDIEQRQKDLGDQAGDIHN